MEKQIIVCAVCGSEKVQVRAWVDINTNEICSDCEDKPFCQECEGETHVCTKVEFEKQMDDWARENGLAWTEDYDYESKRKTFNKFKSR